MSKKKKKPKWVPKFKVGDLVDYMDTHQPEIRGTAQIISIDKTGPDQAPYNMNIELHDYYTIGRDWYDCYNEDELTLNNADLIKEWLGVK